MPQRRAGAGFFIVFEGGEGVGKTTQAGLLQERLADLSIPCELVREPGGTELGEYLRNYLKSYNPLTPEAELLLFAAARAELVGTRIQPALAAGKVVIADRFAASTIAYQGCGRGMDLGVITPLNGFATQGLNPDLVFLLDLAPRTGLLRASGGFQLPLAMDGDQSLRPASRNEEGRRFEDLDLSFHEAARRGFHTQAESDPERWVVIDSTLTIAEVRERIWEQVKSRIPALEATTADAANSGPP